MGTSRSLAAYHLDKLLADGLLEVCYQRRTGRRGPGAGRRGPGAGRPAKLYARSARQVELSLPARDYALLAELLARAVEADRAGAARAALNAAAHDLGAALGAETASRTAPGDASEPTLAAMREVLASRGYEPYDDDGVIRLRNCPFDRIAAEHRQLVCQANLAMLRGLAERLGGATPVTPVLDPRPGRCCVALPSGARTSPRSTRTGPR
jgi:predicted ArsR family transcriptional regulator